MKRVHFDLSDNKIYETYSHSEYSRNPIDYVLYRKSYNRISDSQWRELLISLNTYKITEMVVHKDSLCNVRLH